MDGKSIYKAPNGKLVKIELKAGETIQEVKIMGDFFMHPEEAVEIIEKGLKGMRLDEQKLKERAEEIIEKNSIQVFGFKPEDLAKAIMMAAEK